MLKTIMRNAGIAVIVGIILFALAAFIEHIPDMAYAVVDIVDMAVSWYKVQYFIVRIMLLLGYFAIVGALCGAYEWYKIKETQAETSSQPANQEGETKC